MKTLKGIILLHSFLLSFSLYAQNSDEKTEASEFLESVEANTLDGIPLSEVEAASTGVIDERYLEYVEYLESAPKARKIGFDVPESRAVRVLFSQEDRALPNLNNNDQQIFLETKSVISNTQEFQSNLLDYCRLVTSSEFGEETFSRVVTSFLEFTDKEENRAVKVYNDMLSSLSEEGRISVIEIKDQIHSKMTSSESDWLTLSLSDPRMYFEYQKYNCELR